VAEQVRRARRQSHVLVADFNDPDSIDGLGRGAFEWQGHVDVWINNAGADVLTGDAAALAYEQKLDRLWRVDVLATMYLGRLAGRRMKQQGRGVILNIGWDQAETGMAGDTGELYAAAKGAVAGFTRSLAKSLAPQVRVNCLAPGWIRTAWGQQASSRWQDRAVQESLMARWGTPDDVARVARFLVSPAAEFISGQVIAINGGRS
jgi:3-oxoacyl-[acyl-carrier protein] reductase